MSLSRFLSQVAFTSLFMNMLSAGDLFIPVAPPSTAHASTHTHILTLYNTHTVPVRRNFSHSLLPVQFISGPHTRSAKQSSQMHAHKFKNLLCVFVRESKDHWAYSHEKDDSISFWGMAWGQLFVCVCVCVHDCIYGCQVISFRK